MEYLLIAAAVVFVIIIVALFSSNGNKTNVILPPGVFKMDDVKYDAQYENLGQAIKSMIREGKTADEPSYHDVCEAEKKVQDEWTQDFFSSMTTVLLLRRDYANLEMLANIRERYNSEINLKNGETVLFKDKSNSLFTVQKLFTEVSYGVARTAQGAFRAGAGTIKSHQVEGLKMKSNGTLYLTNKRVIFVGDNNETTVLNFGQIIDAIMYEEDGILLKMANAKPIVFNFNANYTYHSDNGNFVDSRLAAFNVIDSLIH